MTRYYLIIDDDGVCRKILQQHLHQLLGSPLDGNEAPFVIHCAADGFDAAKKVVELRPLRYDLVITDFSMPGMDGSETAKILRVLDQHVPIACLTSEVLDAGFSENCKNAGIFTVVPKPANGQKVLRILVGSMLPDILDCGPTQFNAHSKSVKNGELFVQEQAPMSL